MTTHKHRPWRWICKREEGEMRVEYLTCRNMDSMCWCEVDSQRCDCGESKQWLLRICEGGNE